MRITTTSRQLDQQECWMLLRTTEAGRLCYTELALPVIRAVPFVIDGMSVVVVALNRMVLPSGAFTRPSIVAFEAGDWVPSERRGWSVRLVGRAEALSELEATGFVEQGLTSWIDGEPTLYVRIATETLDGVWVAPSPGLSGFPGPRRNER